jgi:hypothetical protein
MTGRRLQRHPVSVPAVTPMAREVPSGSVTSARAAGDGFRGLQAAHGNQAVQALVHGIAQAKAATGRPGDRWEREADRLAHRVADSARGLDDLRGRMEEVTGADLSGVQLHTDPRADALNRSADSLALTRGRSIYFRNGQYSPATRAGRHLIAHELTHVAQQAAGSDAPATQHMKVGIRKTAKSSLARSVQQAALKKEGYGTLGPLYWKKSTPKPKSMSAQRLGEFSVPGAVAADLTTPGKSRIRSQFKNWEQTNNVLRHTADALRGPINNLANPAMAGGPALVWENILASCRSGLNWRRLRDDHADSDRVTLKGEPHAPSVDDLELLGRIADEALRNLAPGAPGGEVAVDGT